MSNIETGPITAAEVDSAASIVEEAETLVQKIDNMGREEFDIISGALHDAVLEAREALSKLTMSSSKEAYQ